MGSEKVHAASGEAVALICATAALGLGMGAVAHAIITALSQHGTPDAFALLVYLTTSVLPAWVTTWLAVLAWRRWRRWMSFVVPVVLVYWLLYVVQVTLMGYCFLNERSLWDMLKGKFF